MLVIIGLLLGGILKGQELITAARVRNVADQSAGVQAAYYGFIDRYRAVPGDMLNTQVCGAMGNVWPTCPGTGPGGTGAQGGNGQIDSGNFAEASAAWAHYLLQASCRVNIQVRPLLAAYIAPPTPAAPTNPWNGFLLLGRTADYMNVTPGQPPRLHLIMGKNVPVNIMRELDVKVDDSFPQSGILRSAPATATGFPPVGILCVAASPPGPLP